MEIIVGLYISSVLIISRSDLVVFVAVAVRHACSIITWTLSRIMLRTSPSREIMAKRCHPAGPVKKESCDHRFNCNTR